MDVNNLGEGHFPCLYGVVQERLFIRLGKPHPDNRNLVSVYI